MFYNEQLGKKLSKNPLAFALSVASVLLMASVLLTGPSLTAFAQSSGLTPQEQQIQNDIIETQNIALNTLAVVDANQNTDDFRSRWSQVTWIEPGSITAIFVDCEPGEYPQGAQEIFSSPRLELVQSFAVGINQNVYSWLAVVQNQDEQQRHAAAIGVICEGDTDETKRVSNAVYSFDIDQTNIINNIKQIINIKQNVTVIIPTNNTGGGLGGNTTNLGGNTTNLGGNATDLGTIGSPLTNGTTGTGVTEEGTLPIEQNATTTIPEDTTNQQEEEEAEEEESPPAATEEEEETIPEEEVAEEEIETEEEQEEETTTTDEEPESQDTDDGGTDTPDTI
jgi:hypothetical protein